MTIKLAYANQKGGVGKSTLTLQSAYYASQKGFKVLVIDMCSGLIPMDTSIRDNRPSLT